VLLYSIDNSRAASLWIPAAGNLLMRRGPKTEVVAVTLAFPVASLQNPWTDEIAVRDDLCFLWTLVFPTRRLACREGFVG